MVDTVKSEEVDFYNPHEALQRDPGVYLDVVERQQAERVRAVMEDREPDFDNLPAGTGTPLVTQGELPHTPFGLTLEPLVTLEVPVADSSAIQEGSDEHAELAAEANAAREKDLYDARVARIEARREAGVRQSESRAQVERLSLDVQQEESKTPPATTSDDEYSDD